MNQKSVTVLKLKLAEVPDTLIEAATICREARNVASENWLLRNRGMPETPKQAKLNRKGKSLSESTKLYHAITAACPSLGTDVASNISQQVNSFLSTRVDWRKGSDDNGKRPKRRDAILGREERPAFYTDLSVPVANKHVTIHFENDVQVHVTNALRSGQGQRALDFAISLKGVPTGIKRILHSLANGDRKLADSKLLQRRGNWYWYIPVAFEVEHLHEDRVAVLTPVIGKGKHERLFALELPDRNQPWMIGEGRYLIAQTQRLIGLRKQIGWRYRQRMGAGHGRKKVDAAVSKRNQQLADIRTEVRRRAIVDIVRQCERHRCGVLRYHEPTGPAKKKCWFEANGLEFDWTRWITDLSNACARCGIAVEKSKLKWKDIPEETEAAA